MNQKFIDIIYEQLEESIDKGYKAGIRSIVSLNRKHRKQFTFGPKKSPAFNVDYTDTDLEAIENFKMNAFRVAGVGTYDLEEELKALGVEIMESSLPDFDMFELEVREKFLKYGIGLGDQPPSGWIKQNIDTAIKNSLAGARWNRINDPDVSGVYTHWMYMTQKDQRVRDEHVRLDGTVFRIDDANAAKMIPPIDWGCRCYEEYLTGAESAGYATLTPDQTRELASEVPEDFRFNPGSGKDLWKNWLQQKYKDMPAGKKAEIENLVKEKFNK